MKPFRYERASDASTAVALLAQTPTGAFLGGGTNLVDLMKLGVAQPETLIDVSHLPYDRVELLPDGRRAGEAAQGYSGAYGEGIPLAWIGKATIVRRRSAAEPSGRGLNEVSAAEQRELAGQNLLFHREQPGLDDHFQHRTATVRDLGDSADIQLHAVAVARLERPVVDHHVDLLCAGAQDFFRFESFGRCEGSA